MALDPGQREHGRFATRCRWLFGRPWWGWGVLPGLALLLNWPFLRSGFQADDILFLVGMSEDVHRAVDLLDELAGPAGRTGGE